MTVYLDIADVLAVAREVLGAEPGVRDIGLLDAAVARPGTTIFGKDAYPGLAHKGAALLHSLVANHALVDGNKRVGVVSTILFFRLNGYLVTASDDELYNLTMAIASGEFNSVAAIAESLEHGLEAG